MKVKFEFILYVNDQAKARDFYARVLNLTPVLDVPGMTEFQIGEIKLGLMPNTSISKIITPQLPHPEQGTGIPRSELYLLSPAYAEMIARARDCGAREISPFSLRDWGHRVAYFSDPDGHILAIGTENT